MGSLWKSTDEGVPDAGCGRIDPAALQSVFTRLLGQSACLGSGEPRAFLGQFRIRAGMARGDPRASGGSRLRHAQAPGGI